MVANNNEKDLLFLVHPPTRCTKHAPSRKFLFRCKVDSEFVATIFYHLIDTAFGFIPEKNPYTNAVCLSLSATLCTMEKS